MTVEKTMWIPDYKTTFSECRRYRYTLWRGWMDDPMFDGCNEGERGKFPNGYLMVIGLNPSTADETLDDPTIRKCIGFARLWGLGGLYMTNLFAWRDTDPENMKKASEPIGVDNMKWLESVASCAHIVLAAWGREGKHLHQDKRVRIAMQDMGIHTVCLKKNKDGSPMHPLYVPYSTAPCEF